MRLFEEKKNYDRISLPSSLKNWPFSSKMCTFSWITRYKRKMSIYFNLYKNSNKNLFWVILRSFFLEYDNLILFLVLFRPWNGYFKPNFNIHGRVCAWTAKQLWLHTKNTPLPPVLDIWIYIYIYIFWKLRSITSK